MKNIEKRLPRHSIAWKLFASTLSCLLFLLILIWLLNNFVLVSYYRTQKERALRDAFRSINTLYEKQSDTIDDEFYKMSSNGNIRMLIWYQNQPVYDSRLGNNINRGNGIALIPNIYMQEGTYEIKLSNDPRTESNTIVLIGCFTNGYGVLMSTPVAAIQESVDITNRFLLLSGALSLVIGAVFVLLITSSFTKPIRELSRVAGSVARLDFSDRYAGRGKDEINALGTSINTMASALEETVSELKSANLQLMSDNEMKTHQNEARRAFIANVSHELKTPISLIQNYAEGLREDIAENAENKDYYCGVIEDEAEKMGTLIKKMTMLMQLEAGNEQLIIERFDITELMQGIVQKLKIRFDQKQANVSLPENVPVYVWADEFLIENVISNFLANAINHVDLNGEITLTVVPAEGNRVRVSVFNSGSNIPQEDLPRIWESFYKVDKARTRAYGGTGIGLSVVAAIMNAHRMPYGVINRSNGVEFYIELELR